MGNLLEQTGPKSGGGLLCPFPWGSSVPIYTIAQKPLNGSRCRLGCELGWAQRSMAGDATPGVEHIVFDTWRGVTWRIRLNHVREYGGDVAFLSNYFDHLLKSPAITSANVFF